MSEKCRPDRVRSRGCAWVLPTGTAVLDRGEVVEYSGLSRQTIHNYATMGLLRESRWTAGGHRLFDEFVFGRLDQIAELKRRNKTMREIREHFTRVEQS